jgi:GAF domain-containing protein
MSKRLHVQPSFEGAVRVIVDDAIALHGAEFGNLQLPAGNCLVLAEQRGFKAPFLEMFREVRPDDGCACGRALRIGNTVVVEDTEVDEEFAPYRAVARAAGFRSVATTPLLTRASVLMGVVSTHFVNVHLPTPIEIETLRRYSTIAAEFLFQSLHGETLDAKAVSMNRRLYQAVAADSSPARPMEPGFPA